MKRSIICSIAVFSCFVAFCGVRDWKTYDVKFHERWKVVATNSCGAIEMKKSYTNVNCWVYQTLDGKMNLFCFGSKNCKKCRDGEPCMNHPENLDELKIVIKRPVRESKAIRKNKGNASSEGNKPR